MSETRSVQTPGLGALAGVRRALVVGCGLSGKAAALLLVAAGVEVAIYDQRAAAPELPGALAEVELFLGEAPSDAVFAGFDLMVLSPGVPPGPWRERHARCCPDAQIHGELSLALLVAASWPRSLETVLITGTNGKSTVTALTGALLEAGGRSTFTGGNLGVPLSELVLAVARGEREAPEALVLECSSYQLETLRVHGSPAVSVAMLLNVSPDHLDRYDSLEHYAETKGRVFGGLEPGGLALLSARDAFTPRLRRFVPEAARCVLVDGEGDRPRLSDASLELGAGESIDRRALALAGRHNALNALFAVLAVRHLGVSLDTCEATLRRFQALPHRMNPIAEREGVRYFDDSKATNVASVLAGLDGFEQTFVLICGGRAKDGDDLGALRPVLARQGRALVALGESAEQFMAMAKGALPCVRVADMDEAVRVATGYAQPGDAVLLSPACASWDMYRSFVHRGEVFAEAVARL